MRLPRATRGWPQTGFQNGSHQDSRTGRGGSLAMRTRTAGQKPAQSGSATSGAALRTSRRSRVSCATSPPQPAQRAA